MNGITFILLGLAVSFNFIVILRKWKLHRYFDASMDLTILAIICFLFCGTFSALVTGTIASMFVSIWLYFNPVTMKQFVPTDEEDSEYDDDDDI